MRFFAAFIVMVFHLAYWSWVPEASPAKLITGGSLAFPELVPLTWFGWVGVQIFFVLSGFVITYSAGSDAFAFFRSRVLRLVPAAWISATLSAILLLGLDIMPPGDLALRYIRTLLFWPYPEWIDGVYWTLAIEIAFYALVWSLLRLKKMNLLPIVLTAMGLVSSAYWFSKTAMSLLGLTFETPSDRLLSLLLIQPGCLFAIGGLLWINLCREASWWRWGTIGVCSLAGILMILGPAIITARGLGDSSLAIVPVSVWLASVAAIVASVRWNLEIARWINPTFARSLGIATYPLYLLHNIVGATCLRILDGMGTPRLLALVITIAAMIMLSVFVARTLEKPIANLLSWRLNWREPSSRYQPG